MGPSGSGKTTFLNIAGLLDTFDRGRYLLDGVDVTGLSDEQQSRLRNERIGFIFQSFNLIPDLDVYDNVEVPLRYRRLPAAERRDRVEEVLVQMGLTARMRHLPAQLSGRPAAAGRDRARAGRAAAAAARRRADRQPGHDRVAPGPRPAREDQRRTTDDDRDGHARPGPGRAGPPQAARPRRPPDRSSRRRRTAGSAPRRDGPAAVS